MLTTFKSTIIQIGYLFNPYKLCRSISPKISKSLVKRELNLFLLRHFLHIKSSLISYNKEKKDLKCLHI